MEVPFTPVHLFDFLARRLGELDGVHKLNIKAAYQRPCSNRLAPQTDALVDRIFELIGVERTAREYDRKNALCCGGVFEAQQRFDLAEQVRERNVEDMKKSGATHVVFNCPFCYFTLSQKVSEAGMAPTFMSELCRLAAG
jgi:Fe-S oxidoreductase